jgi:hypothetical protein
MNRWFSVVRHKELIRIILDNTPLPDVLINIIKEYTYAKCYTCGKSQSKLVYYDLALNVESADNVWCSDECLYHDIKRLSGSKCDFTMNNIISTIMKIELHRFVSRYFQFETESLDILYNDPDDMMYLAFSNCVDNLPMNGTKIYLGCLHPDDGGFHVQSSYMIEHDCLYCRGICCPLYTCMYRTPFKKTQCTQTVDELHDVYCDKHYHWSMIHENSTTYSKMVRSKKRLVKSCGHSCTCKNNRFHGGLPDSALYYDLIRQEFIYRNTPLRFYENGQLVQIQGILSLFYNGIEFARYCALIFKRLIDYEKQLHIETIVCQKPVEKYDGGLEYLDSKPSLLEWQNPSLYSRLIDIEDRYNVE